MKRKSLIFAIIAIIALFAMVTNVQAADVTNVQDKIEDAVSATTIELDQDYEGDIIIPAGKDITINLNGKTLTSKSSNTITVELGATLTITGEGKIINNVGKSAILNNGTTTINGGTIEKTDKKDYNITNHGTMTINDGTILNAQEYDGTTHASLVENGYYNYGKQYDANVNQKNPKLTINGGTFDGGLNTIKNDDAGILVINKGTFKNQIQVAVFNVNDTTINGGTFEVPKGKDKTTVFNRKYDDTNDIGKITVNGGTFNANYFILTNSDVKGDVTITGGTFNTKLGIVNLTAEDGTARPEIEIVITGGTFAQTPENMEIPEDSVVVKNGESYVVTPKITDILVSASKSDLKVGETLTLKVEKVPAESLEELVVTYSSDNEDVATVDEKGVVTAKAKGTAVITVKFGDKISKTITITVSEIEIEDTKDETPDTGIETATTVFAIIAVISLAGLVLIKKNK